MDQEVFTKNKQLERARKERGWTQQQLADRVGVDWATVGTWERRSRQPLPKNLRRLSDALQKSPKELGFSAFVDDMYEEVFPSQDAHDGTLQGGMNMSLRGEHPNTYFVQDRMNNDEATRLQIQDAMMTKSMGGPLSEQMSLESFTQILDVGCGAGGWLIEIAKTYQSVSRLVGIDISRKMLNYALGQAMSQGVSERVEFKVMDALRMIEFPRASFDLVNQRLGQSYLRIWDWPNLLSEMQRVARPGGIIRLVEADLPFESTSPALHQLVQLFFQALVRAGRFFVEESDGLTSQLASTLEQYGARDVHVQCDTAEYRAGTPEGEQAIEDNVYLYRTLVPFLRKWTKVPANYEQIYQQALLEMRQPDFFVKWNIVRVWGRTPK